LLAVDLEGHRRRREAGADIDLLQHVERSVIAVTFLEADVLPIVARDVPEPPGISSRIS
jgi:hypothetical protein